MANGPPTPPPTTDIELQDEARGSSITEPILPTTDEDTYTNIFPTIADLASRSNFHALIQTAEHSDVNVRLCSQPKIPLGLFQLLIYV